ncbi:craniofacial development protein 2-like [Diadema antillarum]|uniref:craniofacial development protein 2-like n=1 Tax=Diadema antillarum TaxID=105358 RepID=UPI003A84D605
MLDTDGHRPERRSALIAHELSRLDIDIAALSEVRLADEGNLKEHGAGYRLYWSGKPRCERRLPGVGFMVKNSIASRLENLPTGHSDRIMSMRLSLRKGQYITLSSVYAPTLQAEPAEKGKFYTDLRIFSLQVREDDKVIILGDFNARVGKDSETWSGILGKHGVGKCNGNGRLLLEFCTEQQLVITHTLFQQRDILKTTWMHPRSKHWHLLDYILVRRRDQRDVLHTRVLPSAECHTDHRLVHCKLNLHKVLFVALTAKFSSTTRPPSSPDVQESALLQIPQQLFKPELDEFPTLEGTLKAIEQMKIGKAAGVDGIPPEVWKAGGKALDTSFTSSSRFAGTKANYLQIFGMQLSSP